MADSKNTTAAPAVSTRRRFLSTAAGGAALALASLPASAADDPVFGLIEARKKTLLALEAMETSDVSDEEISEAVENDNVALNDILDVVPATLPGVVAWVTYISEVVANESWRVDDDVMTVPLLTGLMAAFNAGVAS